MSLHGLVIDPGGPPPTDSARSPFADHERLAPVSEGVRVWASVALITASTSAGTWTAVAPQPPAWGWLAWLGVPTGALISSSVATTGSLGFEGSEPVHVDRGKVARSLV
jgi:hypothetical protein